MLYYPKVKAQPNYQAWNWDYKRGKSLKGYKAIMKYCIEAGILAANIHNTQPWNFKIIDNTIELRPRWEYHLPYADPSGRNLLITLGCCITNIEVAAAFCGYRTIIKTSNTQIRKTTVKLIFERNFFVKNLHNLCRFIPHRFSNKYPYDSTSIPLQNQTRLSGLRVGNSKIFLRQDDIVRKKSATLTQKAVIILGKQITFAKELAQWLRTTDTKADDGMPGFVAGLSNIQTIIGKFVFNNIPGALAILALKDKKLILSSPMVGVITSSGNTPTEFIDVGRLYQLMAVTAISMNIHSTIMHAVVENLNTNKELAEVFKLREDEKIQLFFRMGYSSIAEYHTPRRHLSFFLK